jgi:hypothetical protein
VGPQVVGNDSHRFNVFGATLTAGV